MQRIDQTACAAASLSAPSRQLTQAFSFFCRGGATRTIRDTQRFWMSPGPLLKAKFDHDSLHVFLREIFGTNVCRISASSRLD